MTREVTRRGFVKLASATALGVASAGAVNMGIPASKALAESAPPEGMWVRTTCAPNCTGSCGMKAFVQDGQIKMISQAADYPYERYKPTWLFERLVNQHHDSWARASYCPTCS